MKYIICLSFLLFGLNSFSQNSDSLTGVWQIDTVINNTESSIGKCLEESKKFTLTLNSDSTYILNAGPGYITKGKWIVKGNKIFYFQTIITDKHVGRTYTIDNNSFLIIDEFMCSELGGKTYYSKIKKRHTTHR